MDELYKRYQAAMHATRSKIYFLPHLETIDLRKAKIRVINDDDGLPNGDSHHDQLRRAWVYMLGRPPAAADEEFGELAQLATKLDLATAKFVSMVNRLYPETLGPWVMIEGLAHDWIGALLRGLMPHFPGVENTDYFRENFFNFLEVEHARKALETTSIVLARRPELFDLTIAGAQEMGRGLDMLWDGLANLLMESPLATVPSD